MIEFIDGLPQIIYSLIANVISTIAKPVQWVKTVSKKVTRRPKSETAEVLPDTETLLPTEMTEIKEPSPTITCLDLDTILMDLLHIEKNEEGQFISSSKERSASSGLKQISVSWLLEQDLPSQTQEVDGYITLISFSMPSKSEIEAVKEQYIQRRSGGQIYGLTITEKLKNSGIRSYLPAEVTLNLLEKDELATEAAQMNQLPAVFVNRINLFNTKAAIFSCLTRISDQLNKSETTETETTKRERRHFAIQNDELTLQLETNERLVVSTKWQAITNHQEV